MCTDCKTLRRLKYTLLRIQVCVCVCVCGTHRVELLPEPLRELSVLQPGSALAPLGLAEGRGEPLHLGAQLPRVPLQVQHLALPLGLAALQLQPQRMPALLQLLGGGGGRKKKI